jgi:hypothetical protein
MPHQVLSRRIGKESTDVVCRHTIAELGLLALMMLVLVESLILLHRNPKIAGPGLPDLSRETPNPSR